jgi:hypothetical protein
MTEQQPDIDPRVPPGVDPRVLDTPGTRDELGLVRGAAGDAPDEEDKPAVPIPGLPEDSITLGGGVVMPDGRLLTEAVVREMNGADEEALSRVSIAANMVRFIDTLVQRCLVSVGGEELSREQKDTMLIGDRDTVVLAIRRATYGDKLKLEDLKCPACGYVFSVAYSLTKDVPIKQLEDAQKRIRTVALTGKHQNAEVVLIDGGTQKKVYADDTDGLSDAEINTRMLRWCVQRIDGMPVMDTNQVREGLSTVNRQRILSYLLEHQPGPRYQEVKQACPSCETSSPLVLGLPDLFRGE